MNSKKFLLIIFCFSLLPALLFAQRYNIKTYSVSNGLPQAQVHDITQTQDGYIWMATYGGGLAKFDGTEFTNYTMKEGLKDNLVEALLVDSNDNLWVATDKGGVARFQGDSLVYPIKNDSLDQYSIGGMNQLSDGSIWFATYKGGVFILQDNKVDRLTTSDGLSGNIVWDFLERSTGDVWIATGNGLSIYDGKKFKTYSKGDGLSGNRVYKIIERKNGDIWLATDNGITIWNGTRFEPVRSVNDNSLDSVYDIIETSDGRLWIATRSQGIYIFEEGQFRQRTEENGLSSNNTYSLFEDHNNQVWIATDEDGVNLYKENGFVFYNTDAGLTTNEVLSIHRDMENVLWLGTTEGLVSFDGNIFKNHPLPEDYYNQYIWNIVGLPNGKKLIAMPDSTLMEFDGKTYTNFSEKYGLKELYIYNLMVDSSNNLWIGTDTGLYKVNLESREAKHFSTDDGLADDSIFQVYEDEQGRIWVGTYYGLNLIDGETIKTFRIEDGLVHNQVNCITQDEQGGIWVGTRGGVSVLKSVKNNELADIDSFDKEDGMRLLNAHFLWFDENGLLWQATNGGLQKLDVNTYRETGDMPITHYPLSDEGIGLEFNFQALATQDQSQAWMGSMSGLVGFRPDELGDMSLATLNITDIKANSVPVNWSDYNDQLQYHNGSLDFPSATFPAEKNIFEFTYRGLSFTNTENIRYRYKLEGFNEDWMPVTKENSAVFTNLDPGDYTFIVQARMGQSGWKANEAKYSFSIAAPFWQTYWFFSIVALMFAGFAYALVRYRMHKWEKQQLQQRVDKQTEHLTAALKEKEVLIKEIHHRVKNNLAVISGLLELQMDHADNQFANRVLSESQRRVQSISMIHEKLYQNERLAEIDFEKYINELIDIVAYSFSNPNKDIEVNTNIDDFKLGVDQGIPCGLILNEVVSNAFEHAFTDQDSGIIDISISLNESQKVKIAVEDNGKGLPGEHEDFRHESLGITLIETLGQQLEGEIGWKSNERGTTFLLEFEKETPSVKLPA
ncbi:two-component regulator propeller domain-containing protein [Fodinibius sp. SL11]|uniref:two-component regulator propeller domain-containing protein n=1 Tax=Fodinibius sp. SL11 TaxID=3425690 RepID=UPI003F881FEE